MCGIRSSQTERTHAKVTGGLRELRAVLRAASANASAATGRWFDRSRRAAGRTYQAQTGAPMMKAENQGNESREAKVKRATGTLIETIAEEFEPHT